MMNRYRHLFISPVLFVLCTLYVESAISVEVDCGFKFKDGTETVTGECDDEPATHKLRIRKGATTYGIVLVPTTDPDATKLRIQTSTGTMAVKKFEAAPPPALVNPVWYGDDLPGEAFDDWDDNVSLGFGQDFIGYYAAADLNGDGRVDLMAKNALVASVVYFRNTGTADAMWAMESWPMESWPSGSDVYGIALGKLDGDDDYDAVIIQADGTVTLHRNKGTTSAPSWEDYTATWGAVPEGGPPGDATNRRIPALADLDSDGDLDLIIGLNDPEPAIPPQFQQYRNDGDNTDPTFVAVGDYWNLDFVPNRYGSGVVRMSFGDLDGDGDPDLIVTDGINTLHVFRNDGGGTAWTEMNSWEPTFSSAPDSAQHIALGDVDGDLDLDLIWDDSGNIFRGLRNDPVPQ